MVMAIRSIGLRSRSLGWLRRWDVAWRCSLQVAPSIGGAGSTVVSRVPESWSRGVIEIPTEWKMKHETVLFVLMVVAAFVDAVSGKRIMSCFFPIMPSTPSPDVHTFRVG
jgi:hypothetical protein